MIQEPIIAAAVAAQRTLARLSIAEASTALTASTYTP
jgi:hypothetical protein